MTDAELVLRARGGDELAFQRLAERHRGLVDFITRKYGGKGLTSADYRQEALLGLWKAARDYRSDRESSFRNFASLCIERQVITALKTTTRNKHRPLNDAASLEMPVGDDSATLGEVLSDHRSVVPDPMQSLLDGETLREIRTVVWEQLSALEREALICFIDGHDYNAVAERLSVSVKAVDNALQRAQRKLRKELLPDGERWRHSEPPIKERVLAYVNTHPDRNAAEVARALRIAHHSAWLALNEISDQLTSRRDGRSVRYSLAEMQAVAA